MVEATHGSEAAIKDALVFLFAAGVIVPLLRSVRVPGVIGFIFAGLTLGPHGLGQFTELWPPLEYVTMTDPAAAALFAELGVLFLLFLLGLELSFERLWAMRRAVLGAGSVQVVTSATALTAGGVMLGLDLVPAAVVGLALALSSTAIVMQIVQETRRLATPPGRAALAILLLQDVLVAPILIFVAFASASSETSLATLIGEALFEGLLAVLVIIILGRFVLARVFQLAALAGGRDFLMALTLLTVVGAAVLTASAGLSLALGAFLAGVLLGETEFKHQTEVDLEPFKGVLLGLFFFTVGAAIDLVTVAAIWPSILVGLACLLVVKFVAALVACRLFAGRLPMSIETASLLAPAGEFAFVILASALAGGLLDGTTAVLISAIAGLSMVLTPFLGVAGRQVARKLEPSQPPAASASDVPVETEGHVVIAGFGRVGRTVADLLDAQDTPWIALDLSTTTARDQRAKGRPVYFGDASQPDMLVRAGLATCDMFIVTVDDAESARQMVNAARALRADLPILARAQDADHAEELHAAGASFVIPDAIEAGLQLAGRALVLTGYNAETVRDLLASERDREYRRAIV